MSRFDVADIRAQFPILNRLVKGKPLVYFDNAATTQKPQVVIDAIKHYYSHTNANVHRGIHTLSEEGTLAMEGSREYIAQYLGAKRSEVIFTRGTTEGINLVVHSLGLFHFKKGDEILISAMEHHANIVPWQILCNRLGLVLKVIDINEKGDLCLDSFRSQLSHKTKLVSLVHTSNALGTINPVKTVVDDAHKAGALVLIDGAQAMAHGKVNVRELDADFFVFSSHKLFGPTGVGILFGKEQLLEQMPPYQSGGEMIAEVSFEKTTYNELPYKFEAGTPHIEGNIVFAEAVKWFAALDHQAVHAHEMALLRRATEHVLHIDGLRIIGEAAEKTSVLSFVVEGVHHQDLALFLDTHGIAVRTGHHCTQPLMKRFGIEGTTRASFSVYNSLDEVDFFAEKLQKTVAILR
ncbi:SufS family cysteine desulfurase [bacterium]|nr:SufS family cysteine desulfurase [bacterium]